MNKILVTAIAILVAGCAATEPAATSLTGSGLRFDYVAENGRAIGLVRAFDDGAQTVLQFVGDVPTGLILTGQDARPLVFERRGQYAVLQGVQGRVQARLGAATVNVVLLQSVPVPVAAPASAVTTGKASAEPSRSELAAAREDVWFAEQQLAQLQRAMKGRRSTAADIKQVNDLREKLGRAAGIIRNGSFP